jgi:hypothetical protein
MNLTGRRFGRLVVITEAKRKGYVLCRCDCGNNKDIRATSLTKRNQPTRSCGCAQREAAGRIGTATVAKNTQRRIATDVRYNTNFGVIEQDKPPVNNRSGKKGVCYDKRRNLWEAYISVHRRKIHLGRFAKYEDAVKARQCAEDEYFRPLIEQKNTQQKE